MTQEEKLIKERDAYMAEYYRKMSEIKCKQLKCEHEWGEPEYDPEIVDSEPIMKHTMFGMVDVGCVVRQRNRWSKTCKKCELKKYTYKSSLVACPKFDD